MYEHRPEWTVARAKNPKASVEEAKRGPSCKGWSPLRLSTQDSQHTASTRGKEVSTVQQEDRSFNNYDAGYHVDVPEGVRVVVGLMRRYANQHEVALLVKALRSSRYLQARGVLERRWVREDTTILSQCCLGVACRRLMDGPTPLQGLKAELATHHDGSTTFTCGRYSLVSGRIETETAVSVLPEAVRQWYGFQSSNPQLIYRHPGTGDVDLVDASLLNDSLGLTFAEIADAFEETYLPYAWVETLARRERQRASVGGSFAVTLRLPAEIDPPHETSETPETD